MDTEITRKMTMVSMDEMLTGEYKHNFGEHVPTITMHQAIEGHGNVLNIYRSRLRFNALSSAGYEVGDVVSKILCKVWEQLLDDESRDVMERIRLCQRFIDLQHYLP